MTDYSFIRLSGERGQEGINKVVKAPRGGQTVDGDDIEASLGKVAFRRRKHSDEGVGGTDYTRYLAGVNGIDSLRESVNAGFYLDKDKEVAPLSHYIQLNVSGTGRPVARTNHIPLCGEVFGGILLGHFSVILRTAHAEGSEAIRLTISKASETLSTPVTSMERRALRSRSLVRAGSTWK